MKPLFSILTSAEPAEKLFFHSAYMHIACFCVRITDTPRCKGHGNRFTPRQSKTHQDMLIITTNTYSGDLSLSHNVNIYENKLTFGL